MNPAYNLLAKNGELQRNIIKEIIDDRNWNQSFQQRLFIPASYFRNPMTQEPVAKQITVFIKEEFKKLEK